MKVGFKNNVSLEYGTMEVGTDGIITSVIIEASSSNGCNLLGSDSMDFIGTFGWLQDICGRSGPDGECACSHLCENRGEVLHAYND